MAETTLRKGLKLAVPVTSLQLTRGASGRVSTVQVTTSAGTTKVTGAALRSRRGLRSTWVTQLVTLSLTRPGGPVRYGKTVDAHGRANGVKGAVLQQRVDGVWTKVAGPGAEGEGEAARAGELPHRGRQAGRLGAEGAGRARA